MAGTLPDTQQYLPTSLSNARPALLPYRAAWILTLTLLPGMEALVLLKTFTWASHIYFLGLCRLPTTSPVDFRCIYFVSLTRLCLNLQPVEFASGFHLFCSEAFLLKCAAVILHLSYALGDKESKSALVILWFPTRMSLDFIRKCNMKLISSVAMFSPEVTASMLKLWQITSVFFSLYFSLISSVILLSTQTPYQPPIWMHQTVRTVSINW